MKLFLILTLMLFSINVHAITDTVNVIASTPIKLTQENNADSDWWDKYSSGIIAALTIFTSLGISVWQARKTQKQSRSNSISDARIQWIQELRPLLGKLISEASQIVQSFKEVEKYIDKKTLEAKDNMSEFENKDFIEIGKRIIGLQTQFENTFNQIKLFLNEEEKEHKELLKVIRDFVENSRRELIEYDYKNDIKADELIKRAQIVLKNTWHQAKTEGGKR